MFLSMNGDFYLLFSFFFFPLLNLPLLLNLLVDILLVPYYLVNLVAFLKLLLSVLPPPLQ